VDVKVIVTAPADTAVTNPDELTVALAALDVVQVPVWRAVEGVTDAVNCLVAPTVKFCPVKQPEIEAPVALTKELDLF